MHLSGRFVDIVWACWSSKLDGSGTECRQGVEPSEKAIIRHLLHFIHRIYHAVRFVDGGNSSQQVFPQLIIGNPIQITLQQGLQGGLRAEAMGKELRQPVRNKGSWPTICHNDEAKEQEQDGNVFFL
jgi:hypothetical protein